MTEGSKLSINGLDVTTSAVAVNTKKGWVDVRVYPFRGDHPLVTVVKGGGKQIATVRIHGQVQVIDAEGKQAEVQDKPTEITVDLGEPIKLPEGHKSGMRIPTTVVQDVVAEGFEVLEVNTSAAPAKTLDEMDRPELVEQLEKCGLKLEDVPYPGKAPSNDDIRAYLIEKVPAEA